MNDIQFSSIVFIILPMFRILRTFHTKIFFTPVTSTSSHNIIATSDLIKCSYFGQDLFYQENINFNTQFNID